MVEVAVPETTKVHFDVDHAFIEHLNGDCAEWSGMDSDALQEALRAQGKAWHQLVATRCPHLFATAPLYITAAQLRQMRALIAAVERVVALPGWMSQAGLAEAASENNRCRGAFLGYDFHLNADGAHLIEINTNAGGGFLNELLLDSQREAELYGAAAEVENLEQAFLDMFHNEWVLARGNVPLTSIAIVDERPEEQYLYPEFLLAQKMFEAAGIRVHIVDPSALQARADGLYLGTGEDAQKIDLVYNRLTDFSLQQHPALHEAYVQDLAVITPHPYAYAQYSDKRNLARLTNAEELRALGATEADIAALQAGIPHTIVVHPELEATLWEQRKQLFFKPNHGYGGKGTYRGANVTKRVFGEILQGDYVAQQLAPPDERAVCGADGEKVMLKYDVRCFVYDGELQLVAARLYQGQTTNFRTPGGGFAVVRVVE